MMLSANINGIKAINHRLLKLNGKKGRMMSFLGSFQKKALNSGRKSLNHLMRCWEYSETASNAERDGTTF